MGWWAHVRPLLLVALLLLVACIELSASASAPPPASAAHLQRSSSPAAASAAALDAVLARHGSRLTAATWAQGGSPAAPPPVFFLTAARAWGGGAQLQASRDEQYATNIGNILSLGFPVFVSVSPGPQEEEGAASTAAAAAAFPLLQELAAAAPPGLLRVHYCSQATAVRRRSGGADELLCMQEAIPALFAGCVLPVEPFAPLPAAGAARGCPTPDTHVIRMSGRYLMAKYDVLRAVHARGASRDAFFKWMANWTETNPIAKTVDADWVPLNVRQVITFMLSMKVRGALGGRRRCRARTPTHTHTCPLTHTRAHSTCQMRHFVQCHMMDMSVAGGWNSASRSVWRFGIEKLTADCIQSLQDAEQLDTRGVLGNIGNAKSFEFY